MLLWQTSIRFYHAAAFHVFHPLGPPALALRLLRAFKTKGFTSMGIDTPCDKREFNKVFIF